MSKLQDLHARSELPVIRNARSDQEAIQFGDELPAVTRAVTPGHPSLPQMLSPASRANISLHHLREGEEASDFFRIRILMLEELLALL